MKHSFLECTYDSNELVLSSFVLLVFAAVVSVGGFLRLGLDFFFFFVLSLSFFLLEVSVQNEARI